MLLGFAVVNIGFSSTPWIRRPDIRLSFAPFHVSFSFSDKTWNEMWNDG
jgi:hypothetical protein